MGGADDMDWYGYWARRYEEPPEDGRWNYEDDECDDWHKEADYWE